MDGRCYLEHTTLRSCDDEVEIIHKLRNKSILEKLVLELLNFEYFPIFDNNIPIIVARRMKLKLEFCFNLIVTISLKASAEFGAINYVFA